jgi:hypothetical protein
MKHMIELYPVDFEKDLTFRSFRAGPYSGFVYQHLDWWKVLVGESLSRSEYIVFDRSEFPDGDTWTDVVDRSITLLEQRRNVPVDGPDLRTGGRS